MCPSESKVILNYDNVPGLENRYRNAVIQPYDPGQSHVKYYMADTVHMTWRRDMSRTDMERLAKQAAPLADRVVIDGMPDNPSHDFFPPIHTFTYAM